MTGNLLDHRTVQGALVRYGALSGGVDGIWGRQSAAAARLVAKRRATGYSVNWSDERVRTAVEQVIMADAGLPPGAIDGLVGPSTRFAVEQWQNRSRDVVLPDDAVAYLPPVWPRQKDMAAFYGDPGENHVLLTLPYPMRLAWAKATVVKRITINAKCADSAARALGKAFDYYGMERLQELGLDLFGGCFENRAMRGGKSLSTHAYACALDINPEANQLRWGANKAAMAQPSCAAFLDAFEAEGWVSLGRERNFDWMHLQAARL